MRGRTKETRQTGLPRLSAVSLRHAAVGCGICTAGRPTSRPASSSCHKRATQENPGLPKAKRRKIALRVCSLPFCFPVEPRITPRWSGTGGYRAFPYSLTHKSLLCVRCTGGERRLCPLLYCAALDLQEQPTAKKQAGARTERLPGVYLKNRPYCPIPRKSSACRVAGPCKPSRIAAVSRLVSAAFSQMEIFRSGTFDGSDTPWFSRWEPLPRGGAKALESGRAAQLRRSWISAVTRATNSSRLAWVVWPARSRMEMLPASASLAPSTSI